MSRALGHATRAANALVRTFLSPSCASCRGALDTPLAGPVCPRCWGGVTPMQPPWCARCGTPLDDAAAGAEVCVRCTVHPPTFAEAWSAGLYDGALRTIVHAFKYGGRRALARPLAARLRADGTRLLSLVDAVVPVPLHPWRYLHRGFNQADDLAHHLGVPIWRGLIRIRHGPPQASLPASARRANVRRAFRIHPLRRRHPPRRVLLIDDVMTTGETMEACSQVLMEAGVARVTVLTVARAAESRPRSPPRGRLREAAPH